MSGDLVERLRHMDHSVPIWHVMRDAADEIERLSRIIQALPLTSQMVTENARLRARLAAAEAVCEALIDDIGTDSYYWGNATQATVDHWREVSGR